MESGSPVKRLLFAGGVFLDALLISNEKGAESSKILKVFVHVPLLTRDDDRRYFPALCGVSETTMGHSRQASVSTFPHLSPFTKGDDRAKTVPVLCCF